MHNNEQNYTLGTKTVRPAIANTVCKKKSNNIHNTDKTKYSSYFVEERECNNSCHVECFLLAFFSLPLHSFVEAILHSSNTVMNLRLNVVQKVGYEFWAENQLGHFSLWSLLCSVPISLLFLSLSLSLCLSIFYVQLHSSLSSRHSKSFTECLS